MTPDPFAANPRDPRIIDALYEAVDKYVKSHGGKIIVIGGIECQEWPLDMPHSFRIAIRCTGKPPAYLNAKPAKIKADKKAKKRK